MPTIIPERVTAHIDGDFVVFLIGVRINRWWRIDRWLPVILAMPRMLRELQAHPELGLLGQINGRGMFVQYWRSFDHLEAYARGKDHEHLPAWKKFNQTLRKSRGDVGIWHETFRIRAGEYETVYNGMPLFGLASAGRCVPAAGQRDTARGRLESGHTGNAGNPAEGG